MQNTQRKQCCSAVIAKLKIHTGGQAVSRYHQVRTIFPDDDMPQYEDHDFPIPNYLVEPDGYLFLHSKSHIPVMIKDKLCKKNVLEVPATGPMCIDNRCAKNTSTHCASHIKDIQKILAAHAELKRTVFAAITDGWYVSTGQSRTQLIFHGSSVAKREVRHGRLCL